MYVKIAAIIGIVIIECVALYMGRNGKVMALAVGLVGGIGGYTVGAV